MNVRRGSVTRVLWAALMAWLGITGLGAGQAMPGDDPAGAISPLEPPFQQMRSDELFSRLIQHNQVREDRLQKYSAMRTYQISSETGKVYAEEVVRIDYQAPDSKTFKVDSKTGSGLICNLVFKRLIESESEAAAGRQRHDSSIRPENYRLRLIGEQEIGPRHCLVAEATPRRRDKYLFEGKVWIDAEDYGIVRIAGRPARSLSFWIRQADFVRDYQKIGEFWLPARDYTLVDVRIYGKRILTIDHHDYSIETADAVQSSRTLGGSR